MTSKVGDAIRQFKNKYSNLLPMKKGVTEVVCTAHVNAIDNETPIDGYIRCTDPKTGRMFYINLHYDLESDKAEELAESYIHTFLSLAGVSTFPGYLALNEIQAKGYIVLDEPTETTEGYMNQKLLSLEATEEEANAVWKSYFKTADIRRRRAERRAEMQAKANDDNEYTLFGE